MTPYIQVCMKKVKCWKQLWNSKCSLFHEMNASFRHILCGCQVALAQGRQTWRHDSVLLAIYQTIREMRNRGKARFLSGKTAPKRQSKFVSASVKGHESAAEGSKFSTQLKDASKPLFESSDDWELQVDVCVCIAVGRPEQEYPFLTTHCNLRVQTIDNSNQCKG